MPRPLQKPWPPVWVPGSRSRSTLVEVAKRGFCYFLSSRSHGGETHKAQQEFAAVLAEQGRPYHPSRFGILLSVYVAETDRQAREECEEGVWYFLRNCLKGHLRRDGRQLTFGPGVPYIAPAAWQEYLKFYKPGRKLLGDAASWDELDAFQSIIVGSPETVFRRLANIVGQAKAGNLLYNFTSGTCPTRRYEKACGCSPKLLRPIARDLTRFVRAGVYGSAGGEPGRNPVSGRILEINRRKVWILEKGDGPPLLYLHGFADVHGVAENWLPFHERLSLVARIIAPAHPGCAETDENGEIDTIEDVVFHYLEVLDALRLTRFDVLGACVGGWIAAEIAVRHPEKIRKLALVGAAGLLVEKAPIGDIFMMAQPERGASYAGLRQMLARPDDPRAIELFPDGLGAIGDESRRYKMLRFASRVGFKPPYFYNRSLMNRLYRITAPTLVVWGDRDNMVPLSHGDAYARTIGGGRPELKTLHGAGHSVIVEEPETSAAIISEFLRGRESAPD